MELLRELEQLAIGGAPVFLLEGIDGIKPVVDVHLSFRVEVDALQLSVHLLGNVFHLDGTAVQALAKALRRLEVVGDVLQQSLALVELARNTGFIGREQVVGGVKTLLDAFCVAQNFRLLFQGGLLALLQVKLVQLVHLKLQEVHVALLAFHPFPKLLELPFCRPIGLVAFVVLMLLVAVVGHGIHHREQEVLLMEQEVLVLRVNIDEVSAQFFQGRERYRSVIDEGATLSVVRQFSADDALVLVVVQVVAVKERFHAQRVEVEGGFHHAAPCSLLQRPGIGPLTENHAQCTEYDALSCSRFTRNDGEPGRQFQVELLDQGIVLNL